MIPNATPPAEPASAPPTAVARIRPAERDALVAALRSGVVPRAGIQHIQVGRSREVAEIIRDMDRVADGGSSVRIAIGEYGSGKTFFLTLCRLVALQKGLVTAHADLSPDRRLHGTGGQARALLAELLRNAATRTRPDGGALPAVVERFLNGCAERAAAAGGSVADAAWAALAPVREMVGGHDFARVVAECADALHRGDDARREAALRWLRAEYGTRTEAREALGVRAAPDDASLHDHLKLVAAFSRAAGYKGLLVVFDEMVNVHKLVSAQARASNYEQMLRMANDALQGSCPGLGFVFAGTPEFLEDPRRGMFSYEALRSRFAENAFARGGMVDLSGPVVRLQRLTREDMLVLLERLRDAQACGDPARWAVPDEALPAFMARCEARVGEAYFRTPRNTIKAFLDLLAVLEQNPGADWRDLVGRVEVEPDPGEAATAGGEGSGAGGDDLAGFRL